MLLTMSDRRTKQGRTVLLGDGEQRDFRIKVNELFNDDFLDVAAATVHGVVPALAQVFRRFGNALTFS